MVMLCGNRFVAAIASSMVSFIFPVGYILSGYMSSEQKC